MDCRMPRVRPLRIISHLSRGRVGHFVYRLNSRVRVPRFAFEFTSISSPSTADNSRASVLPQERQRTDESL
jgi:hypothetical protein